MPKVTVLLSSFNHEKFISETLDSILNQTFSDFELYIVDDCSSDNSWKIIDSYTDERIIKIKNETNTNDLINPELFSKFKGEYLAVAHSDDTWEKTKLEKQVEYLDNHPDTAACFTWVKLIDYNSEIFTDQDHPYHNVFNTNNRSRQQWLREFFFNGNKLCHPSSMIRMSVQLEENLFVFGIGSLPDFYRWIKLCLKHEIYVIEENLTNFRIQGEQTKVSGLNKDNITRASVDNYFLGQLFIKINDKDLIITFPEIKKYYRHNKINYDFAKALFFIEQDNVQFKLAGFSLLFNLLNNRESKQEIKKIYGYSNKDMINDCAKYDIFSVINSETWLNSSIWLYSDKFHAMPIDNKKYNIKSYIFKNNFKIECSIKNCNFKSLRFDPDEGTYRSYEDIKMFIDDTEIKLKPFKNYEIINNKICFYTMDPIFYGKTSISGERIIITGKTNIINCSRIQEWQNKQLNKTSFLIKILKRMWLMLVKLLSKKNKYKV